MLIHAYFLTVAVIAITLYGVAALGFIKYHLQRS